MKNTIIQIGLVVLVLAIVSFASSCVGNNQEQPDPITLQVESLLRRYGKQETVTFKLTNKSQDNIIFADNQYGMNLFKKRTDGTWIQIINPLPVQSTIHILKPGEPQEVILNYRDLDAGEYKVVFEGWKREDISKLIKGEATFHIYPHPTFKAELINKNPKASDTIDIMVTNDRVSTIFFHSSILNLRVLIRNEAGEWMQLPSPLYNDNISFNLDPGQSYNIQVPALRAQGNYKIVMSGVDESGLEVSSEIDIIIR